MDKNVIDMNIIDLKPGDLFQMTGRHDDLEEMTAFVFSKHCVGKRFHVRALVKTQDDYQHIKLLVFNYGPVTNSKNPVIMSWHYHKVYERFETHWRNYSRYECVEFNLNKLR